MSDFEVVVVGGGLGGLTAGLFSARCGRSTVVLESTVPGGHLVNIEKIEDFPGFPEGIAGYDLGPLVQEQAASYGAEFAMAEVQRLEARGDAWLVTTSGARAAGLATAGAVTGRSSAASRSPSSAVATRPSWRRSPWQSTRPRSCC